MTNRPTKVLLVDDVRLFLELEKTFFRRQGCEIFTATTGIEALNLAQKEKPDLIVLDLFLPEIDGLEVIRRIRALDELKNIKLIIVTTSGKDEDVKACQQAGCDAYLTKPITQKKLLDTAAQLLRIPQRVDLRIWVEMEVKGERDGDKFYGQSDNISVGGIYIKSEKSLPAGAIVNLRFSLPEQDSIISVQARLLRVDESAPVQDKILYGLAFQFVNLDPLERRQIETLVQSSFEPKKTEPPGPATPP